MRTRENLPPSIVELNATLSGADGALSRTLEAGSHPGRGGNAGWRDIWDGTGMLIERRDENFTSIEEDISVSGSLAWKPASGTVANLNAMAQLFEGDQKQVSRRFPAGGPEGRRLFLGAHQRDPFWREVCAPDRNRALVRSEEYARAFGPIFTIELKGKF